MATPRAHNVIRPGTGHLVLTADFPATGRTVAGFGDLFRDSGTAAEVWETAPPVTGTEAGMTGEDQLARWLADLGDLPVTAVLGFCVGAVYAAGLAERIERLQGRAVPVVVLDPERPDLDLLHRHYEGLVDGIASVCSPDELADLREDGRAARAAAGDMATLAAALTGLALEHGGPALRRTGLDERRCAELIGTFRAFLGYLVAAADLDPRPVWSRATALSSATPPQRPQPAAGRGPGERGRPGAALPGTAHRPAPRRRGHRRGARSAGRGDPVSEVLETRAAGHKDEALWLLDRLVPDSGGQQPVGGLRRGRAARAGGGARGGRRRRRPAPGAADGVRRHR